MVNKKVEVKAGEGSEINQIEGSYGIVSKIFGILQLMFYGLALICLVYGMFLDVKMFYTSGPLFGLSYACDKAKYF